MLPVDVLPAQRQDLASSHSRRDRENDGAVQRRVAGRGKQLRGMVAFQRLHLAVLRPRRVDIRRRIPAQDLPLHHLLERLPQHPMVMEDRLGGQTAPLIAAAGFERLGVLGLDVQRPELGQ